MEPYPNTPKKQSDLPALSLQDLMRLGDEALQETKQELEKEEIKKRLSLGLMAQLSLDGESPPPHRDEEVFKKLEQMKSDTQKP